MKNRQTGWMALLGWLLVALLAACSQQEPAQAPPGCQDAPRPVVFVHGFLGGGDNFAQTVMRFASNDYCPAYLQVFDWNSLSFDVEGSADQLADFIDRVLAETGAKQVDLVGHSMGGRLSHAYLADEKRAAKVAHYVHAASFCDLDFPDEPPLMTLSSQADTVAGRCTFEGADNQELVGADHLQVVTVPEAFEAMYRFFNQGQAPTTTDVVPEPTVTLAGKVISFGFNQPAEGATLAVYPVDPLTGERLADEPQAQFSIGPDGSWGALEADPDQHYEFYVSGSEGRPFHYYRQTFPRSDRLVYLRVLPESNPLIDNILGELRFEDQSSAIVLFSANQALYHGRDTASLDDLELVTPDMAPPPPDPTSTIAIFIFDVDGDGQTDGGPGSSSLAEFPFLQPYDAFLAASPRRSLTLTVNGATLHVPTWPGDSQGPSIVIFDRPRD